MGVMQDIDPDLISTIEGFDSALEGVTAACAKIEMQLNFARENAARYGEMGEPGWHARATYALRSGRAKRDVLIRKRAELARRLREGAQANRDRSRERLFISACRELLPKETFLMLWRRVDEIEYSSWRDGADGNGPGSTNGQD